MTPDGKDWVLIDGECGMCRRIAAWLRPRDREHRLQIVPYQEAPSPPITPALYAACPQAMHIVCADGTVLRAGRATLYILALTGWGRVARLLMLPPFIWLAELAYFIVARNRPFFARFLFRGQPAPH